MHTHFRAGAIRGIALLAVTLLALVVLPRDVALDLVALVLALTGGIYLGFAWLDRRPLWVALEGAQAVVLVALALAGLHLAPAYLALGFLAHVVWDLAHHPRGLQTRIARWVPPACLVYDVGVALAVLYVWPPW